MEIFIIALCAGLGLGTSIGGFLYLIDPKGWKGTVKRLSTLTRASLETSKPVKVLEAKKEDKEVSEWDTEFADAELQKAGVRGVTGSTMEWIVKKDRVIPDSMMVHRLTHTGDYIVRLRPKEENGPGKGNYAAMELSPTMTVDKEKNRRMVQSWHEMLGKAKAAPETKTPKPVKLKHEIVKKDFYSTHLGLWPQWHCKCGTKGHAAVVSSGIKNAQERADREAQDHVKSCNEAEELKAKSGGKFAW